MRVNHHGRGDVLAPFSEVAEPAFAPAASTRGVGSASDVPATKPSS